MEGVQGALLAPGMKFSCPGDASLLSKSCLVSVTASNSLSIVTLTNNPTEVRAAHGNKTCSVSELRDSRVRQLVS